MTLIHLVSGESASSRPSSKLTFCFDTFCSIGGRRSPTKEVLAFFPRGCAACPRAFFSVRLAFFGCELTIRPVFCRSSDTLPSEQVSDMFASVTLLPGWTFPDLLVQPNLELPQSFSDAYAASLSTWTPSADAPNPVQDEVVDWPALVGWKMSSSDPIAATLAGPFMGGHSLAKVRAGVEVVARLEVLNQAVSISLQGAPTLPFCACELVGAGSYLHSSHASTAPDGPFVALNLAARSTAYCLLLLAITLQASETIADVQKNHDELNAIWTSCWALLRGLRRYGDTWDGLDGFAGAFWHSSLCLACAKDDD